MPKMKPKTTDIFFYTIFQDVFSFVPLSSIRPKISVCYLFKFIFFQYDITHLWLYCTHSQRRVHTLKGNFPKKKRERKWKKKKKKYSYIHRIKPNAFAILDISIILTIGLTMLTVFSSSSSSHLSCKYFCMWACALLTCIFALIWKAKGATKHRFCLTILVPHLSLHMKLLYI